MSTPFCFNNLASSSMPHDDGELMMAVANATFGACSSSCFCCASICSACSAARRNACANVCGIAGVAGAISLIACSIRLNCSMNATLNAIAFSPVNDMVSNENPSRFIKNMGCRLPWASVYVVSANQFWWAKFLADPKMLRIDFITFLCNLSNTRATLTESVTGVPFCVVYTLDWMISFIISFFVS